MTAVGHRHPVGSVEPSRFEPGSDDQRRTRTLRLSSLALWMHAGRTSLGRGSLGFLNERSNRRLNVAGFWIVMGLLSVTFHVFTGFTFVGLSGLVMLASASAYFWATIMGFMLRR